MLAEEIRSRSTSSSDRRDLPNPSPRSAFRSTVICKPRGGCYFLWDFFLPSSGFASTTAHPCSSSSNPPRESFGRSCSRTTTGVSQYVYPSSASTGSQANFVRTRSSPTLPSGLCRLFHFTVISSYPVFETFDAGHVGTAGAAIESSFALQAVADDGTPAMGALGGERVDRAFE